MGDTYDDHMEMLEEDYFFGVSETYNDECPVTQLREAVNSVFAPGVPFAHSPMRLLYEVGEWERAAQQNHQRLLRSPFRENDRWNTSRYVSARIADMENSHLSNACAWMCKRLQKESVWWWKLLRMEVELLRRGVERTGIEHLIPAIEQHRDRCRAYGWARSELTWQERVFEQILARSSARQD